MAESLHYTRVFADAAGESHLEQCELEMGTRRFAPPAPPLDVSAIQSADGLAVLRLPPHWWGEWHPSPYRQWLFFMSGSARIQVSDGTQREVSPGSISKTLMVVATKHEYPPARLSSPRSVNRSREA